MPNWCSNYVDLEGPDEVVEKFLAGIDMEKGFIETYYPTPEELKDAPVTNHFVDEREGVTEEEKARRLDLIEKYGSTDWYNWQISHWGCKWGDCELVVDGRFMRFETAWSPPLEALEHIATLFPGLIFEVEYEEEGLCFAGKAIISNILCSGESWDTQWNEETEEMEKVDE